MPKKTISIRDIARLAGVSTATVSKVLNGKGSISQATREHVLEIAQREGYVANFAAKTLREARTRTVGIVTPDVSNDFYSSIVLTVETLLYESGYVSYVCDSHNDPAREADYLRSLVQRQVDGIVFVGGRRPTDWDLVPAGMPTTCIDRNFGDRNEATVHVSNDWPAIIRDATRLLAKHGCQRIAYLAVSRSSSSLEDNPFLAAYAAELAANGLVLDRNLVLHDSHQKPSTIAAEELVSARLNNGWEMDGIVAIGDRVALGALRALEAHGLAVGKDVLVIGVDNSLYSRIASPALSSVDRHVDELAQRGVKALLAQLSGVEVPERTVIVAHEVIERASTLGA